MSEKNRAFDHRHYTDWRKPEELVPYEKNAKIHDEKQIRNLVTSLRRFGWQQDCAVTTDGVLVIGHGRRLAAMRIGCEIPVHVIDKKAEDLTDEDIRELRIADNQTNAETGYNFGLLAEDIGDLDFDGFDFDFHIPDMADWFDRDDRNDRSREEGNDEYNEFLEKFEQKKTTDDCYTPENVYEAVADWVSNEYSVTKENFVRPFYPGGDYRSYDYPKGCAVVDNPPFSILAEIVDFYTEKKIPFFLFSPGLVTLNYINHKGVCAICLCIGITYENGASVSTSFLTNMDGEQMAARSSAELYDAVYLANKENEKAMHMYVPKYEYPPEVLTGAKIGYLSKYGQNIRITRDESIFIRQLDAMKESGKGIFGNGLLLSERMAAERMAAEQKIVAEEKAITWKLSEREMTIVKSLGKGGADQ